MSKYRRIRKGDRVGLGFPAYVGEVIRRDGSLVWVRFDTGHEAVYDEWHLVRLPKK